jgi:hypothetical protein
MVEDTVFEYLRVECTMKHTPESSRRVVPAESTPLEIAQAVVSHIPGRRFCQQSDD